MHIASVKALAVKLSLAAVAAGALIIAGAAPAPAQQLRVAVQYGAPAYVGSNVLYRDNTREFSARQRAERELYERRQREEFLSREARLRHERWVREHHNHDRNHGTYGYR